MEQVTVDIDDELALRARKAAEREGKSLSDYVSDLLVERLPPAADQRSTLDRILALPSLKLTDEHGRLPSREEMYAE